MKNKIELPISVLDDYKNGVSVKDISINFRCSIRPVYNFLKENGVKVTCILSVEGKRYGRLVILKRSNSSIKKVVAICDCGKTKEFLLNNIIRGDSRSCGCYLIEKSRERAIKNIKHNLSRHPLCKVWTGMKERCYNKKCVAFLNYGGRGIKICDNWVNDLISFYNWAILNGWEKGLEIDRIDVNGNYEPSNCRFVSSFENSRNKRNNILISFNGEVKILKDWAVKYNVNYKRLHKHIKYKKLTFEEALKRQLK
jgi:hypothetical protein